MEQQYSAYEQQPQLPMKWHKFLIYFSLWAGALLSLVNAANYFTGAIYEGNAAYVYSYFGGLSMLDKAVAFAEIGLCAFTIITRFALAGFKQGAPGKLITLYILNLAVSLLYVLLSSMLTGIPFGEMLDSSTISSFAVSIALLFYNKSYYEARTELFVN